VEENRALAPQATQTPQGRSSVHRQPSCVGRDFVDSAQRRSLAGSAGEISAPFVLAAAARLRGVGHLFEHLARFLSELNEREELDRSESFLDGSFAPTKKEAQESGKPSGQGHEVDGGGRRPGCSFGRPSFTLPPRRKSGSRKPRSRRPRRPPPSRGPAAPEANACDFRPGLRQRSLAPSFAVSRDPIDPPAQEKSRSLGYARWPRCAGIENAGPLERTIGWLGNFRRLVMRYDRSSKIYGAFFHIASLMTVLRRVVQ
jgi:hypothetical protein